MAKAQEGDTVKVHYTGKIAESGEVFDSTEDTEPLEFTIGEEEVIPGFEELVTGLEEGDSNSGTIEPKNAYGQRRDDMIAEVEKDKFPDDLDLEVGKVLQLPQPDDTYVPVEIIEMGDDTITIDGNHELAGQDLEFEVELVEIVE